jgi:predicted acetyltransferase
MVGVQVDVVRADEGRKRVIRRLLELNAHDFSAIDGRDLSAAGEYGYPYLDDYWAAGTDRHPFLILAEGRIAGCALVRAGDPHRFGEFFVVRKYRRAGVGTQAARDVLTRFPGRWDVHEVAGHDAAVAFWRQAIPTTFHEIVAADGTHQHFTIGP